MTKIKNSKSDKTQKFKMWQNSKTQTVTKLKNLKCEKKLMNSTCVTTKKNPNLTKLKKHKRWHNFKLKILQNSKTQNMKTTTIKNLTKLNKLNCDKTY